MSSSSSPPLRVALFPDCFHEANGVGTLSRQLSEFAKARGLPFLVVRGGGCQTQFTRDGSLETLELRRSAAAFPLDKGLDCDPLLIRHKQRVIQRLEAFKPDLVHITGPGDLGFLGIWVAHILRIPLVASWHTNLHEYLSRRLQKALWFAPRRWREKVAITAEHQSLRGLLRFYRMARFILAPNASLADSLNSRTGRPAFVMGHGVDLNGYSPAANPESTRPFCIGYVGRLTAEKDVRSFVQLERQLLLAGERNFRLVLVGEGGERRYLEKNLRSVELPGVLRGGELANAYRSMDAFVFPSQTDTFGLVMLEAMASGVPVIAPPATGARVGVQDGVSGFLSEDFAASVLRLMHDPSLRRAMSCAARCFADANSWCSVFDRLYKTYAEGLAVPDLRRGVSEGQLA